MLSLLVLRPSAPLAGADSAAAEADSSTVRMVLNPANPTASLNQIFDLDVIVAAGSQQVDGAQAVISFNPAYLRVVDLAGNPASTIIPGSAMDTHIANSANNSTGRIFYSDGQLNGPLLSGDFTLARIHLRAVGAGTSAVAFSSNGLLTSMVSFGGVNVLHDTANSTVTVVGGPTLTPTRTPTAGHWRIYLPIIILNHPQPAIDRVRTPEIKAPDH